MIYEYDLFDSLIERDNGEVSIIENIEEMQARGWEFVQFFLYPQDGELKQIWLYRREKRSLKEK